MSSSKGRSAVWQCGRIKIDFPAFLLPPPSSTRYRHCVSNNTRQVQHYYAHRRSLFPGPHFLPIGLIFSSGTTTWKSPTDSEFFRQPPRDLAALGLGWKNPFHTLYLAAGLLRRTLHRVLVGFLVLLCRVEFGLKQPPGYLKRLLVRPRTVRYPSASARNKSLQLMWKFSVRLPAGSCAKLLSFY